MIDKWAYVATFVAIGLTPIIAWVFLFLFDDEFVPCERIRGKKK